MKKVEAIIQPFRLEAVKEALNQVGVSRMTVSDVQGFGRQKGHTDVFRGQEYEINFIRKVKLEIVVNDDFLDVTLDTLLKTARSESGGKIGDGKIFVLPIEEVIRVRTGERGGAAV